MVQFLIQRRRLIKNNVTLASLIFDSKVSAFYLSMLQIQMSKFTKGKIYIKYFVRIHLATCQRIYWMNDLAAKFPV